MNFEIIKPPHCLAGYIRFFWYCEANATTCRPYVHHAFAHTCAELIFCYKGRFTCKLQSAPERTLTPGFYGQTRTFGQITSKEAFGVFGVYLYPHTFPQLFGIPANELTDQVADLKTICGREAEVLEERIMLAAGNYQRVKLVSGFLQARLKNANAHYANIFSSVKAIIDAHPLVSVKTLATDNFLSLRQFERRFKEFSGFPPKLFSQITRFNSLINKNHHHKSLTQIAHEHGYYDQSHFIHSFQEFSGYSPKAFFKPGTITASDRGTIEFNE